MTMMATTEPPLSRLFSRIDSLPCPRDERLGHLLELWNQHKDGKAFPKLELFAGKTEQSDEDTGFVFIKSGADARDYVLQAGPHAVRPLLGNVNTGSLLSSAPERRGAVRCCRLFNWVLRSGEPLLVEFQTRSHGREMIACEMLAMPFSEGVEVCNAVLGGFSFRWATDGSTGRHHPAHYVPDPLIFTFGRDESFARLVAQHLHLPLSPLEEREFEDGEHKARPLIDVVGREVYVIASLHGDETQSVNDRLCRLLFFIGALKTNGASNVIAVTPYLCYLRKDRQTKLHDPLTGRYVAELFEAMGTDAIMTMEGHNLAALQNAFRIPVIHLKAYDAFAAYFAGKLNREPVTVLSPDLGAGKRAEAFREALEERLGYPVGKAFMEKQRSMGVVTGDLFAGDVAGKAVIVFDDMISTGTTMVRAAAACRQRGASRVYLAASHGLFSADAPENLTLELEDGVCVTNTISSKLTVPGLNILDVSGIFAQAIGAHARRSSILRFAR